MQQLALGGAVGGDLQWTGALLQFAFQSDLHTLEKCGNIAKHH